MLNLSSPERFHRFLSGVSNRADSCSIIEFDGDACNTADVLKVIASNCRIESLDVFSTSFGRNLTCLIVSFNKIKCIQALAGLPSLEYLDVCIHLSPPPHISHPEANNIADRCLTTRSPPCCLLQL